MDYQSSDLPTYEEALNLPKAENIPPVPVTARPIQTTLPRPTEAYNSFSTSQQLNGPSLRNQNLMPETRPTTTNSFFSSTNHEYTSRRPEPPSSYYYGEQPKEEDTSTYDSSNNSRSSICDYDNGPIGAFKIGNNVDYNNFGLFSITTYERRGNRGEIVNIIAFDQKVERAGNGTIVRKYSDSCLEFGLPGTQKPTKVIIPMGFHKMSSRKKKFYGCVIVVLLFIMLIYTCYGLSVTVGVTV
ncbi:hypothetical protein NEIRO03_2171 [Nematocida sp. AWRm78]|nr:hypothetical protein NEIRO03_2171 [Nematocida sp. AWRm78]